MKLGFMKLDLPKRPLAIAAALVAVASVVAGRERPAALEVMEPASRNAAAPAALELDLGKLRRPEAAAPLSDPFAPRSFAAPREDRAIASQAREAPPLPFSYFGKLTENGKTEVFVMRGDEVISIAAGRKIDAEYRVDAVSDSSIRFTYLPLKTRQSLELGEAPG